MTNSPDEEIEGRVPPALAVKAIAIAVASGILFVVVPYAVTWLLATIKGQAPAPFHTMPGLSLTLLFPLVQGFALSVALGRAPIPGRGLLLLIFWLFVIELSAAWFFFQEGVICLIILAPLVFIMLGVGAMIGRAVVGRRAENITNVSLIPLVALLSFGEALGPDPEFSNAVVDSVVVQAPPEVVWQYIASYPQNDAPPEYWLWRIGLPTPIQSVAEAPRVGATRVCQFTDGIAFEERITELVPNEVMTFEVTKQPDHPEVIGHFQFDKGEIRLVENTDGSTTIVATSWYRLFARPAFYFDWWTADITRQVHFRVLNHIKRLAERDYAEEAI